MATIQDLRDEIEYCKGRILSLVRDQIQLKKITTNVESAKSLVIRGNELTDSSLGTLQVGFTGAAAYGHYSKHYLIQDKQKIAKEQLDVILGNIDKANEFLKNSITEYEDRIDECNREISRLEEEAEAVVAPTPKKNVPSNNGNKPTPKPIPKASSGNKPPKAGSPNGRKSNYIN